MISIAELLGAISIFTAMGFLLIFIKENAFDKTTKSELNFQNTNTSASEPFIDIDMDSLAQDVNNKDNPEHMKEKKRRLESFKLRNKFYHMK